MNNKELELYEKCFEIEQQKRKKSQERIKELEEEIIDLRADYGTKAQIERDLAIDKIEEYIEHLKEELEEEKRIEQEDFKAITKLEDKIDKAIEYIENDLQSFLYSVEYKTLLNILKGNKNE